MTQANIAFNKRLGAVLEKIQADQRNRDEQLLASKSVALRQKRRLRTARVQADVPPESP